MRLSEVKQFIAAAVLEERERCAKICDTFIAEYDVNVYLRHPVEVAKLIREQIRIADLPEITVIRPETAVAHPERVTRHTIVAGQALIEDKIVDRKRMQFA